MFELALTPLRCLAVFSKWFFDLVDHMSQVLTVCFHWSFITKNANHGSSTNYFQRSYVLTMCFSQSSVIKYVFGDSTYHFLRSYVLTLCFSQSPVAKGWKTTGASTNQFLRPYILTVCFSHSPITKAVSCNN